MPASYSLRSLFARKSTSVAAALGIALVVFVFASSLMLSRGVRRTFVSAGSPDRAVVLRKGAGAELTSGVDSPTASLVLSTPGVKREAGQPLGTPELVVVVLMDKLGMEGKVANVQLRGITETSWRLRPEVRIVEGRAPRPGTDEVAVGRSLRGRFRGLELGGRFEIKKNRWAQVVGILGAGGSGLDSEIWVDLDTLRSTFGRAGLASSVLVRLDNASAYDAFRANVEHDKRLGLEVFREPAYYDKQSA